MTGSCPFCGSGDVEVRTLPPIAPEGYPTFAVVCKVCRCAGPPTHLAADHAVALWAQAGTLTTFKSAHALALERLTIAVGGNAKAGGPVVHIVCVEMAPKTGESGHRRFDYFLVDEHDRALGCHTAIFEPPKLEIRSTVYDAPRGDYLNQANPLAAVPPHSTLN